ncbi:hypothetical protein AB0J86_21110 [Micromonospora sp. NPDC049559]|uniref:hypothetical protein n=1 Tax=Micromonospora sp. NPDC049559 TaxID=3155923 RepID=UPI003436B811
MRREPAGPHTESVDPNPFAGLLPNLVVGLVAPLLGPWRPVGSVDVVDQVDVGVPVRLAYDQWTQIDEFPGFATRPGTDRPDGPEGAVGGRGPVFWSRGEWEVAILEQVPDERVVWRSRGEPGVADGTVSFHELTPDLTRILVVLAYRPLGLLSPRALLDPRGLVRRGGDLGGPVRRRVRAGLLRFVRRVMTETLLDPDAVRGWRGEIRSGRVLQEDAPGPAAGDGPGRAGEGGGLDAAVVASAD